MPSAPLSVDEQKFRVKHWVSKHRLHLASVAVWIVNFLSILFHNIDVPTPAWALRAARLLSVIVLVPQAIQAWCQRNPHSD